MEKEKKYEKLYEYITDTIPKIKIDLEAEQVPASSLRGEWSHLPDMIWKREALVCLENFPAGAEVRYQFWFDEVHYILAGKAELTYSLPCTRFSVEKTMIVEKGDAYICPRGGDLKWKIDPSGPFTKFCVVMPGPLPYKPELMPPEARGMIA